MPPRVRRGKSAYEFRTTDGRTVRLCNPDLTKSQVWAAYENFNALCEEFFNSGDFHELATETRMTREQLIDAARKAAPLLPAASQWLMNELANRYDVQAVVLCESMEQRKALAVENTVLRDDVICWAKECDRIVERHTKTRSNLHLLEAQRELRELTPVTNVVMNEGAK
jgi:hypothetical protein